MKVLLPARFSALVTFSHSLSGEVAYFAASLHTKATMALYWAPLLPRMSGEIDGCPLSKQERKRVPRSQCLNHGDISLVKHSLYKVVGLTTLVYP